MNYLMIIITILLILAGILGIIIPGIPDLILIFAGILIYALFTHFASVGTTILLIFGGLVLLGYLFDYLGTIYGAKKYGASNLGVLGAIIGGFLGLIFLNFLGFFIGAVMGTVVFEVMFARKELNQALRAGFGASLGLLFGIVGKIILAIIMIALFLKAVW